MQLFVGTSLAEERGSVSLPRAEHSALYFMDSHAFIRVSGRQQHRNQEFMLQHTKGE